MFAPETAVRLGRAACGLREMRRDVRAARAFAPYLGCRAKYPKVQSVIGGRIRPTRVSLTVRSPAAYINGPAALI
jgi:hypothetical protein